jgi:hypothetical protein
MKPHQWLIRKLLTRPIHYWETHRSYPIKQKVFDLHPITVNASPSKILLILTTPNTICDAAWAVQSLLRHLPSDLGLSICIDGKVSSNLVQSLNNLFPNVIIQLTDDVMENICSVAPKLAGYGKKHPLGRKLAVIACSQRNYNVLYSDSDILCFREVPEVWEALTNNSSGLYMQDIGNLNADNILLNQLKEANYDFSRTLNSGFLYIPRNSFNTDSIEHLLSYGFDPTSWFVEQTILAVLMAQSGAKPLPKSTYVVSAQRQFYFEKDIDYDQISIRHFVTPVRHLMYSKGMPKLWKQWK